MANHRQRESDVEYRCPRCGKSYKTMRGMRIHEATHDRRAGGPVQCPRCGKTFRDRISLEAHTKTHDYKTVVCEICGREFRGRNALSTHILRTHDEKWRAENLERLAEGQRTPEARARHSVAQKKVWNKPGYRENFSQKISDHWADPEYKDRVSAKIRETAQDPEHRAMVSEKLTEIYRDNDELRSRIGAAVSKAFSTPEKRKMLSENSKRMWRNLTDDERAELCAKISEGTKASWQRPEVQENHRVGWRLFFDSMTDEERIEFISRNARGIHSRVPNRAGVEVHCDSTYEDRFCKAMLRDPNVSDFDRFHGLIPYGDGEHSYNPDFDVTLVDGRRFVIEIKSDWTKTFDDVKEKIAAAVEWCMDSGCEYVLLADDDLMNYEMETTVGLDPIMWSFDQSPDAPAN